MSGMGMAPGMAYGGYGAGLLFLAKSQNIYELLSSNKVVRRILSLGQQENAS